MVYEHGEHVKDHAEQDVRSIVYDHDENLAKILWRAVADIKDHTEKNSYSREQNPDPQRTSLTGIFFAVYFFEGIARVGRGLNGIVFRLSE